MKIVTQEDSSKHIKNEDGQLLRRESVQERLVVDVILIPCYVRVSNYQGVHGGVGGIVGIERYHRISDDV